jgi:hypothetical protein
MQIVICAAVISTMYFATYVAVISAVFLLTNVAGVGSYILYMCILPGQDWPVLALYSKDILHGVHGMLGWPPAQLLLHNFLDAEAQQGSTHTTE